MTAKQFEIWLANLEPGFGTEAGKTRPVLVIQTNFLNKVHPSTIVCPITTAVNPESKILRVNIPKGIGKVKEDCDIMIDQLRAIDNRRLIRKTGEIPDEIAKEVIKSVKIILDIES